MKIINEKIEAKATKQLQAEKPGNWRARYTGSDLPGAIRAAARYARATRADAFVIASNSYGHFVWHISDKLADVTSIIVNSGKRAYRVTPDANISKIEVEI